MKIKINIETIIDIGTVKYDEKFIKAAIMLSLGEEFYYLAVGDDIKINIIKESGENE